MHSRGSLAKALRASGLYEALEEAQVFDLESLTDDDWCSLIPSEHHRQQFAEVVQRLWAPAPRGDPSVTPDEAAPTKPKYTGTSHTQPHEKTPSPI
ncbi:hypothetical protein DIPPA_02234 [Diplonema papillatum]|nr:hypothetical protein DIPPA_02234 [Diplonema papillatum]